MKDITLHAATPPEHIGNSTVERNAFALKFAVDVHHRGLFEPSSDPVEAANQIVDIARTFANFMWEER